MEVFRERGGQESEEEKFLTPPSVKRLYPSTKSNGYERN